MLTSTPAEDDRLECLPLLPAARIAGPALGFSTRSPQATI